MGLPKSLKINSTGKCSRVQQRATVLLARLKLARNNYKNNTARAPGILVEFMELRVRTVGRPGRQPFVSL